MIDFDVGLASLDLSSNFLRRITEDDFKNMNSIIQLRLSYNLIESIDKNAFDDLKELSLLDLDSNKLALLYFNNYEKSSRLRFKHNQIETIKISTRFTNFIDFDFSFNNFSYINLKRL